MDITSSEVESNDSVDKEDSVDLEIKDQLAFEEQEEYIQANLNEDLKKLIRQQALYKNMNNSDSALIEEQWKESFLSIPSESPVSIVDKSHDDDSSYKMPSKNNVES